MRRGYQAKWSDENDRWELYVTLLMAPMALIGAKTFIRKVNTERYRTLNPGPRKDHLAHALKRLEEPGGLEQVLMPQDNGEVVFFDAPLPDDAKTPFSDLGSIKK